MIAFISRAVGEDSVFRQRLTAAGWELRGQSLVTLRAVDFPPPPPADWLFFYSSNGVKFFFDACPLPPHFAKIGVIGPATAAAMAPYGHKVDFEGTGEPTTTALQFLPHCQGQRVLFVGAAQSRQSVQTCLGTAICGAHWTVYDNQPLAEVPDQRDAHTLVFTSPLNAAAYLQRHAVEPSQRVVAIGDSTATALHQAGVTGVVVSKMPTEASLADAVLGG